MSDERVPQLLTWTDNPWIGIRFCVQLRRMWLLGVHPHMLKAAMAKGEKAQLELRTQRWGFGWDSRCAQHCVRGWV